MPSKRAIFGISAATLLPALTGRAQDRSQSRNDATGCNRVHPMSDFSDRVRKIIVEHLGVAEEKVVDQSRFIDDLGADSLDTVELVMAFEEAFGVEIPDDVAEKIITVGDLKNVVCVRLGGRLIER